MRQLNLVIAGMLLPSIMAVGGCATTSSSQSVATTNEQPAPASAEPFDPNQVVVNAADVTFAQQLLAHNAQALELAQIALEHQDSSSGVVGLAQEITSKEQEETMTCSEWLEGWGMEPAASPGSDGTIDPEQVEELRTLTGQDFNDQWLKAMIASNEASIALADTVLAGSGDELVMAFATRVKAMDSQQNQQMSILLVHP